MLFKSVCLISIVLMLMFNHFLRIQNIFINFSLFFVFSGVLLSDTRQLPSGSSSKCFFLISKNTNFKINVKLNDCHFKDQSKKKNISITKVYFFPKNL